jgi:tetratricopeptide (TPR) repeat protein
MSFGAKLHALLSLAHQRLGHPDEALAALRAGQADYPGDGELLFLEALLLRERGDDAAAEARFRELLRTPATDCRAGVDLALHGYKAKHNLAQLCLDNRRPAEAEALWREVLAEQPALRAAWSGLARACLAQGLWPELEEALARLRGLPGGPAEADQLAARARAARGEAGPAAADAVPDDIPGWFDFADVYRAAVGRAPAVGARFVEVGSWLGKSTVYLARQIAASGKGISLTAVDTFRGSPGEEQQQKVVAAHGGSVRGAFEANLRRYGVLGRVAVLEAPSVAAAASFPDGTLDFVFIDADHAYESARADLLAWLPKVRPGGVLAGHDIDSEGVARAVREVLPPTGVRPVGVRCWSYEKPAAPRADQGG